MVISSSALPGPLLLAGGGEAQPDLGMEGEPFGVACSDLAEAGGGALGLLWSALAEAEDRVLGGALALGPLETVGGSSLTFERMKLVGSLSGCLSSPQFLQSALRWLWWG